MNSLNLIAVDSFYLCLLIFIFGICIGSFLNVVINRLPGLIDSEFSDPNEQVQPNLIKPRSRCSHCKHTISWYDNLPLISYLILKGHCRHCGQVISKQYFWIELLTGFVFVMCYLEFGMTGTFIWSLILSSLLIALAGIDLNTWLLPDSITLPGILLGLVCNTFNHFSSVTDAAIGALAGYLILWLIYQIHHKLTAREGMGYGDFKLLAMLGAWLGWYSLPIIMLISSLAGLLIFIFLKLVYKFDHTQALPFGPFLAIAGWIYMLNHLTIKLMITT